MGNESDVQQVIADEGGTGKYFHLMLNIDDEQLDPYQYRLLGHYRRVCGAYNKPCTEGTRATASNCKMSTGKVSGARQELAEMGLITLHEQEDGRLWVTVVDRMRENVQYFHDRRSAREHDRSPHEHPRSAREHDRSAHERKNKQDHKQQEPKQLDKQQRAGDGTGASDELSSLSVEDRDSFVLCMPYFERLAIDPTIGRGLLKHGAERLISVFEHVLNSKNVDNPAGLALSMLGNNTPAGAEHVTRAQAVIKAGSTAREDVERELRHAKYGQPEELGGEESSAPVEPDHTSDPARDTLQAHVSESSSLTVSDVWKAAIEALKMRNFATYMSWLSRLTPVSYADGVIVVEATNENVSRHCAEKLHPLITGELEQVAGTPIHVTYVTESPVK